MIVLPLMTISPIVLSQLTNHTDQLERRKKKQYNYNQLYDISSIPRNKRNKHANGGNMFSRFQWSFGCEPGLCPSRGTGFSGFRINDLQIFQPREVRNDLLTMAFNTHTHTSINDSTMLYCT